MEKTETARPRFDLLLKAMNEGAALKNLILDSEVKLGNLQEQIRNNEKTIAGIEKLRENTQLLYAKRTEMTEEIKRYKEELDVRVSKLEKVGMTIPLNNDEYLKEHAKGFINL